MLAAASMSTARELGVPVGQLQRAMPHHLLNDPRRNPGGVGQGRRLAPERMEVEDLARDLIGDAGGLEVIPDQSGTHALGQREISSASGSAFSRNRRSSARLWDSSRPGAAKPPEDAPRDRIRSIGIAIDSLLSPCCFECHLGLLEKITDSLQSIDRSRLMGPLGLLAFLTRVLPAAFLEVASRRYRDDHDQGHDGVKAILATVGFLLGSYSGSGGSDSTGSQG